MAHYVDGWLVATCNKAAWLQPAIKQHMVATCNKAASLQPAFKQHARWHSSGTIRNERPWSAGVN
jgi:hypothetical protein